MRHEFRLAKAQEALRAAQVAFDNGLWESSVSGAYYAAYHLAAAVLAEKADVHRDRWDHMALYNAFQSHFCRRSFHFNVQDGRDFLRLMEDRFDADYHNVTFNQRRAERSLRKAEALCSKILEVI